MLTVHHLGHSQSERIIWLCEELGVPYELKLHERDHATLLSPPALGALHPLGAAPVIEDDGCCWRNLLPSSSTSSRGTARAGCASDRIIPISRRNRTAMAKGDPDLEPMLA